MHNPEKGVVMSTHNSDYVIFPDATIIDKTTQEKVEKVIQEGYPVVWLRKDGSTEYNSYPTRVPFLLAYYFLKDFKPNYKIVRKNRHKPWTVANIETYHHSKERKRGVEYKKY